MRSFCLLSSFLVAASAGAETPVAADAATARPLVSYSGFNHGFENDTPPSVERVRALAPKTWRVREYGQYPTVAAHTSNIVYVLSDTWLYLAETGALASANPSADWELWELYVERSVAQGLMNGQPIAAFDVWNEADHHAFWAWSYDVLLEAMARAAKIIRAVAPGAKVVGPSFASFESKSVTYPLEASAIQVSAAQLVLDLHQRHDVRFDVVSWHENEASALTRIEQHAQAMRATIAAIGGGYAPQLAVNEYNTPLHQFTPVALAAYLVAFDRARLDNAGLACWDARLGSCSGPSYSTCWAGLNGLLAEDGATPLAPYWVMEWHARERGVRLEASAPDARTLPLVSYDAEARTLRGMVGRAGFQGAADTVRLRVTNLPDDVHHATVRVARLTDATVLCEAEYSAVSQLAPTPPVFEVRDVEVLAGVLEVVLEGLPDLGVALVEATLGPADSPAPPSNAGGCRAAAGGAWMLAACLALLLRVRIAPSRVPLDCSNVTALPPR